MTISQVLSANDLGQVVDTLIENSFDSVMVTEVGDGSSNTPIVYVNQAFTELTGYSADEVKGKSPTFLQGPDTDPEVIARLREDLATGKVFEGKTTNYKKDGSPFTMHWRVAPVDEGNETPRFFIAIQRLES